MDLIRLPSLDDLNLDEELRKHIMVCGGKKGPLDWIKKVDASIPIVRHRFRKRVDFRGIQRISRNRDRSLLVRSNNYCELLPGSEGKFNTVCVYPDIQLGDETRFNQVYVLPQCPADHLKDLWPKTINEMRFAYTTQYGGCYRAQIIEHPNQEGVFWITITDPTGNNKISFISNELDYFFNDEETIAKFDEHSPKGLEKLLEIARKVVSFPELDNRYTKQMEFVFPKNGCVLSQIKILSPKNRSNAGLVGISQPSSDLEQAYRTYGRFDEVVTVVDCKEFDKRKLSEDKFALLFDFKDITLRGRLYSPNISLAIFNQGIGMLEHRDIPYFIYSNGVAVGYSDVCDSFAFDSKNHTPIRLKTLIGKKVRLQSDGRFLYATQN